MLPIFLLHFLLQLPKIESDNSASMITLKRPRLSEISLVIELNKLNGLIDIMFLKE